MMGYGKLLRRGGGCYYDIQKVSTTKSNFTQREGGREREREREREALKQACGDASGGQAVGECCHESLGRHEPMPPCCFHGPLSTLCFAARLIHVCDMT
mmetsp:Transcript_97840/g.143228  ORF Transcript_97840/g.143228 Transcript_97840/m.143228 type:complete len:99 (+) Transcript_97840:676-972(+)